MDKFKIQGGQTLSGEINISGSKNAALPPIAASVMFGERIVLEFINTNELSVAPATVQESLTTKEINEQKLKYFFTLKKELEEAGLI